MMQRPSLFLALLLLGTVPLSIALSAEQQWRFRVFLDDKEIGTHHFSLQKTAETHRLTSEARFDVKILFINAYKYIHDAQENWRGDCLIGMSARTDDNGKQFSVMAKETTAGLNVITPAKQFSLPGCVMSFAYWNPLMLQQKQLLNAQTGEHDEVDIKLLSTTTVSAAGKELPAKRYSLTGKKLKIDLWYSLDGEWLALESTTENGRRLRYVLN